MVSFTLIPASPLEVSSCVVVSVPWMDPKRGFSMPAWVACPSDGTAASMNANAATACRNKQHAQRGEATSKSFRGATCQTIGWAKVMVFSSQRLIPNCLASSSVRFTNIAGTFV